MAEDTKGLPDVDLGPILDDIKAQQEEKQPTQTAEGQELDLGQFKNPKDLLKSYKEIQAAFTRVTQENKQYKEELPKLKEELEMVRYTAPVVQSQPQVRQHGEPVFDGGEDIDTRIQKTVAVQRIAEVLEEEAEKNRGEFQERYAYAQMIAREYPQLSSTSRGVKKLFEIGDKRRAEDMRKNAGRALETIFGEPLGEQEIARLKTLVKGNAQQPNSQSNLNAYMPDTSTSTRTGSDIADQNQKLDLEIRQGADKGDVDGVIAALFKRQLAE